MAELSDRKLIKRFGDTTAARRADRLEHGLEVYYPDRNITVTERDFGDESDDDVIWAALASWLHDLTDRRNRVVHDSWFIGWHDERTRNWSSAEKVQYLATPTPDIAREVFTGPHLRALAFEIDRAAQAVWLFAGRRGVGPSLSMPGQWEIREGRVWPPAEPPEPSS